MNQRHHFVKAFANAKSFPKRSPEEQARFSKAIDQAINEDIIEKARLEREVDRTVKPAVTKSQLNPHAKPFVTQKLPTVPHSTSTFNPHAAPFLSQLGRKRKMDKTSDQDEEKRTIKKHITLIKFCFRNPFVPPQQNNAQVASTSQALPLFSLPIVPLQTSTIRGQKRKMDHLSQDNIVYCKNHKADQERPRKRRNIQADEQVEQVEQQAEQVGQEVGQVDQQVEQVQAAENNNIKVVEQVEESQVAEHNNIEVVEQAAKQNIQPKKATVQDRAVRFSATELRKQYDQVSKIK
jgi:hypothetical protein